MIELQNVFIDYSKAILYNDIVKKYVEKRTIMIARYGGKNEVPIKGLVDGTILETGDE